MGRFLIKPVLTAKGIYRCLRTQLLKFRAYKNSPQESQSASEFLFSWYSVWKVTILTLVWFRNGFFVLSWGSVIPLQGHTVYLFNNGEVFFHGEKHKDSDLFPWSLWFCPIDSSRESGPWNGRNRMAVILEYIHNIVREFIITLVRWWIFQNLSGRRIQWMW